MRIISQNRTVSYELSNLGLEVSGRYVVGLIGEKRIVLGAYNTEERAIDVFLDIHESYAKPVVTCYAYESEADVLMSDSVANTNNPIMADGELLSANVSCENSVYYMPEI